MSKVISIEHWRTIGGLFLSRTSIIKILNDTKIIKSGITVNTTLIPNPKELYSRGDVEYCIVDFHILCFRSADTARKTFFKVFVFVFKKLSQNKVNAEIKTDLNSGQKKNIYIVQSQKLQIRSLKNCCSIMMTVPYGK